MSDGWVAFLQPLGWFYGFLENTFSKVAGKKVQYSLVFIKVFASEARLFAFLFPLKNHASILVWHGFLFPGLSFSRFPGFRFYRLYVFPPVLGSFCFPSCKGFIFLKI
jgi:hypothetical protein